MTTIAKKILFFGRVQGVGFRWRTERAARGLAIGGYVRNLADGSVELVAEGDDQDVGELLSRIRAVMGEHIDREVEAAAQPSGATEFRIRQGD